MLSRQQGWTIRLAGFVCAALLLVSVPAWAERMALVVGNGDYNRVAPLKNPVNDANMLSTKLEDLGFAVTSLSDQNEAEFWPEFDQFVARAADAEIVLFFYSGHAFQLGGVNYLVPVDAGLGSVEAIRNETWSLDHILGRFAAIGTNTVVMLDACRNNPLPPSMQSSEIGGGLARIESGADLLTVFATQPDMVAYEGTGELSYFTQALLDHMDTDGASLVDVVRNVRNQVRTETNRRQIPWSGGNLSEAFYFKPQIERRSTLSDVDLENLLMNFPPEQRPAILESLAESMGLDVASLNTRIDKIAPEAAVEVIIGGDTVDHNAPSPTALAAAEALPTGLTSSPLPKARPFTVASLAEIEGTGDIGVIFGGAPADPIAPIEMADGITGVPVRAPVVSTGERLASNDTRRYGRAMSALVVSRANVPRPTPQATAVLVPVAGTEFWLDDRTDIGTLPPEVAALAGDLGLGGLEGKEMARAVQIELARLGCYRNVIDGDFGKGSRLALTSYYLAKAIVPPKDVELTTALLRQLQIEPNVVCTGTQTRAPQTVERVAAAPVAAKAAPKRNVTKQVSKQKEDDLKSGKRMIGIRLR